MCSCVDNSIKFTNTVNKVLADTMVTKPNAIALPNGVRSANGNELLPKSHRPLINCYSFNELVQRTYVIQFNSHNDGMCALCEQEFIQYKSCNGLVQTTSLPFTPENILGIGRWNESGKNRKKEIVVEWESSGNSECQRNRIIVNVDSFGCGMTASLKWLSNTSS